MVGRYSIDSELNRYIPDTSTVINGGLRNLIEDDQILPGSSVIIHLALISELENQANQEKKAKVH